MERKVKFVKGEHYHLFSRGVEKRKIFLDEGDYKRFLVLLYILNQADHFHFNNFLNRGKNNISDIYNKEREKPLTAIHAYSVMPNHFHLIVQEIDDGQISKFLLKLLTAYSMYFNIKYNRSGPLFVRPFRSRYIENDQYFRHIFNYVHLNCLDLYESAWKRFGIKNKKGARDFLNKYEYSSYPDFCGMIERNESRILSFDSLPPFVSRTPLDTEEYEKWKEW